VKNQCGECGKTIGQPGRPPIWRIDRTTYCIAGIRPLRVSAHYCGCAQIDIVLLSRLLGESEGIRSVSHYPQYKPSVFVASKDSHSYILTAEGHLTLLDCRDWGQVARVLQELTCCLQGCTCRLHGC
jgi:hypothetical protein